jgi:hypothetical protein
MIAHSAAPAAQFGPSSFFPASACPQATLFDDLGISLELHLQTASRLHPTGGGSLGEN